TLLSGRHPRHARSRIEFGCHFRTFCPSPASSSQPSGANGAKSHPSQGRAKRTTCLVAGRMGYQTSDELRRELEEIVAVAHKILLIEDSRIVREPLARLLQSEGFYVSSAADGAEAMKLLEAR